MDTCPATRSGKTLTGMKNNDALIELSGSNIWERSMPALACAIAEIFDGYVTHIDHKDPEGFYFRNKEDRAEYIKFSIVLDACFWTKYLRPEWKVNHEGFHGCTCSITREDGVSEKDTSQEKDINHALILSLIKTILRLKRKGYVLFLGA